MVVAFSLSTMVKSIVFMDYVVHWNIPICNMRQAICLQSKVNQAKRYLNPCILTAPIIYKPVEESFIVALLTVNQMMLLSSITLLQIWSSIIVLWICYNFVFAQASCYLNCCAIDQWPWPKLSWREDTVQHDDQ